MASGYVTADGNKLERVVSDNVFEDIGFSKAEGELRTKVVDQEVEIQRLQAALDFIYAITAGNHCTEDDPDGLMLIQRACDGS